MGKSTSEATFLSYEDGMPGLNFFSQPFIVFIFQNSYTKSGFCKNVRFQKPKNVLFFCKKKEKKKIGVKISRNQKPNSPCKLSQPSKQWITINPLRNKLLHRLV